jgi:hypothetical protein
LANPPYKLRAGCGLIDPPAGGGGHMRQRSETRIAQYFAFAAARDIPARNHTVSQFLAAGFILIGIGFAESG